MTERNEPPSAEPRSPDPRPSALTGPTEPVAPAASAAPTPSADPGAPATATSPRRPWYRHVWVPVVGAVVLVLLAFGSGFVAGQATSLFRVATVASGDGPAWGEGDDRGPGWRDGGPGHGDGMPGLPGPRGDADAE